MNAYRPNEVNHCPGCARSQWLIGRVTAECAFCATAMPLADGHRAPPRVQIVHAPTLIRSTNLAGPAHHRARAA